MPEISTAVTEAFYQPQRTAVFEPNQSVVSFIIEGLLTHFFCYYDEQDSRNISWFLEYINEQEHLLRVQLPRLSSAALHPSLSSRGSSYDSEEVDSPILSSYYDTDCVPLNMLKYFLLRILGSCSEGREARKQWIPPYKAEVNCIHSLVNRIEALY